MNDEVENSLAEIEEKKKSTSMNDIQETGIISKGTFMEQVKDKDLFGS